MKDSFNTVHQHINPSPQHAHATSYGNAIVRLDPKGRLKGNEQHVVHFNFIEQIPLKINRHKKMSLRPFGDLKEVPLKMKSHKKINYQ